MSNDSRHSRHHLFAPIGVEGQRRLENSRVAIVGCGALGSRAVELLARAGVGRGERGLLRIIDRDYVDESNLQRQALFDEDDARRARPKAAAAAAHLRRIDSKLTIETHARDLNASNAIHLLADVDLVLDGTDNFRARYVINDAALMTGTPWIYAGAVASRGIVSMIASPLTPCLRCLLEHMPPLGVADTCDTAGVITSLPSIVVGIQTTIALRFLATGEITHGVTSFDAWAEPGVSRRSLERLEQDPECPSCGTRLFPALYAEREETVTLCGRNSVQLSGAAMIDLEAAASRLAVAGALHRHDDSITVELDGHKLTAFVDGRVIVEGTTDPHEAKVLAARFFS